MTGTGNWKSGLGTADDQQGPIRVASSSSLGPIEHDCMQQQKLSCKYQQVPTAIECDQV